MTKILDDVALISGPSARSRAYAQRLTAEGILPGMILYQPGDEWLWTGADNFEIDLRGDGNLVQFKPREDVRDTFEKTAIPSLNLPATRIDDSANLDLFRGLPQKIFVFSGYGTGILSSAALKIGKRFLHVHGGFIPKYRGSTAFYYSILLDDSIGASAIWMDSGIDTGPVLLRERYPLTQGIDIDYILDPMVRADTLISTFLIRIRSGTWPDPEMIPSEFGETFHKIHPILKHLALRRCNLVTRGTD